MNVLEFKSLNQVELLGDVKGFDFIDADEFFALQKNSIYRHNSLPIGKGVNKISYARVDGEDVIVQFGDGLFYMIANTDNFGIAYLSFVWDTVTLVVEPFEYLPLRKLIYLQKEVLVMSTQQTNTLREMLKQQQEAGGGAIPFTQQDAGINGTPDMQGTPNPAPTTGGGMTTKSAVQDSMRTSFARAYGFVMGYICKTGPYTTMQLKKTPDKSTATEKTANKYTVQAVQSKPSKYTHVLVGLPRGCCMKDGAPATPADIQAGNVDFNQQEKEPMYFVWHHDTAVAYIGALGKALPEYAPTHTSSKTHHSAEDIINNKSGIGFVEVIARRNRRSDRNNSSEYLWSLKSTLRRTLFMPGNFIPLKLITHISTECTTAEQAYNLNQIAFSGWDRKQKDSAESKLDLALSHVSSQIFKREYTLADGKVDDAIGSVFFMESDSMKVGDVDVPRIPLSYVPWHAMTQKGKTAPPTEPLKEIARKDKVKTQKGNDVYRFAYITAADSLDHKEYKEYKAFYRDCVTKCMTEDEFKAMATTTRKSRTPGSDRWDPSINASFQALLNNSTVQDDTNAILNRYGRKMALA